MKSNNKLSTLYNIYKKTKFDYFFVFFAIFLCGIYFREKTEISIFGDHFGLLSAPAKIAGYNWDEVLKLSEYYGPGYFIIYVPFLKTIKDPIVLYNGILNVCFAVTALAGVLLLYILNRTLLFENRLCNAIVCIISANFVLQSLIVGSFGNEQMIVLISLVLAILIVKIIEEQSMKKKVVFFLLLEALIIYSIAVHLRNIVFIIGIIGVFLYLVCAKYIRVERRTLLYAGFLIIGALVVYLCYKVFPNLFSEFFFSSWGEGVAKNNLEIDPIAAASMATSFEGFLLGFFIVFVGNIYASIKQTYGLILISYYLTVGIIVDLWKNRKNSGREIKKIDKRKILFVFSTICYWVGLIALSVVWNGNIRGSGYWRYYGSYSIVMLALSLAYVFEKPNFKKQEKILIIPFLLILLKWFMKIVMPRLDEYLEFWFIYPHLQDHFEPLVGFWLTFIMAMLGMVILFFSRTKARIVYPVYFMIFYVVVNFGGGGLNAFTVSEVCDTGYLLINELEKQDVLSKEEDLYYIGENGGYMYYQYMMLENGVNRELPENDQDILVFSNSSNILAVEDGWVSIQIDSNEFVYSKSEKLLESVTQVLYEMK